MWARRPFDRSQLFVVLYDFAKGSFPERYSYKLSFETSLMSFYSLGGKLWDGNHTAHEPDFLEISHIPPMIV